ncbi:MAG: MerR family transcriptional regulator [Thermoguttaceae bacterium]|jgi:DNA-binding transcriptional MerR regulator|nr:MerR family transcriptional regulator [Thermoguttaceae bacterium]
MDNLLLAVGQVAALLGCPRESIHNWDNLGLLHPSSRRGTHRRYTYDDLVAAVLTRQMKAKGISRRAVVKLVEYIQHGGLRKLKKRPYVVVSGDRVWACQEGAVFLGDSASAICVDLRAGEKRVRELVSKWLENARNDVATARSS